VANILNGTVELSNKSEFKPTSKELIVSGLATEGAPFPKRHITTLNQVCASKTIAAEQITRLYTV